ncbi:MAG: SBBP repeat-containing protein [Ignavibacteriae bacterium]|nr:SBBP repeat-containing protein [Ignavibacteriota bacterium]
MSVARQKYNCILAYAALLVLATSLAAYADNVPAAAQRARRIPDGAGISPASVATSALRPPAFVENRGQIRAQDGAARDDLHFLYAESGFHLQLSRNGFSYELLRYERKNPEGISEASGKGIQPGDNGHTPPPEYFVTVERVDVQLVGASFTCTPEGFDRKTDTDHYYLEGLGEQGVRHVVRFGGVRYRDVYPGIDLEFHVSKAGNNTGSVNLKYNFIVHPGADPSMIRLKYNGAMPAIEGNTFGNGNHASRQLTLPLEGGRIVEQIPLAYVSVRTPDGNSTALPAQSREVSCGYKRESGMIGFTADAPTGDSVLVIDPTLMWATYYGGSFSDETNGVAIDPSGNVYAAGTTLSSANIATVGTYQSSYTGMGDAYVVKFNSSGVRQWGTYFGGGGSETAYAISAKVANTIVVAGVTTSTTAIATSGVYQTVHGGGTYDGLIFQLTAAGARTWSSYVGGASSDYLFDVAMNSNAQIVTVGTTTGSTGLASGGHQGSPGGGAGDGIVFRFTTAGARTWSSYFGGSADDQALGCDINNSGDVLVSGLTSSTTGIATTGAMQAAIAGGQDAFIARFTSTGALSGATYFGGTSTDVGRDCAFNANGDLLLVGGTNSTTGIATSGSYKSTYQTNGDGFLAKFPDTGSQDWGTYLGDASQDDASSLAVDASDNIFVTGWTNSSTGIATGSVHQGNPGGMLDAMLLKFDASGTIEWATYYGGGSDDRGFGIALMPGGSPVICGSTSSSAFIATTSAHQLILGGQQDGFVARFFGSSSGNDILIQYVDKDTLCAGETITVYYAAAGSYQPMNMFTLELSNGAASWATPVSIGQVLSTTSGVVIGTVPTNTPTGTNYRVRIVSSLPQITSADNGSEIVIFALPDTALQVTGSTTICTGDSVRICAVYRPTYTYQWKRNGLAIPNETQSCIAVRDSGLYSVMIINQNRCPLSSGSVRVRLDDAPTVLVTPLDSVSICEGDSATLQSAANPLYIKQWKRDGVVLPDDTSATLRATVAGLYHIEVQSPNGCTAVSNPVRVRVFPKPDASVTPPGPHALCNRDSVLLQTSVVAGQTYQWRRNGTAIPGAVSSSLRVRDAGEYTVVVTTKAGCTSTSPVMLVSTDTVPKPRVSPAGPHTICEGDSVRLNADPPGSWTIQWYRNGTPIPGATQPRFATAQPGVFSVIFTATPTCTTSSGDIIVDVKPRPAINISSDKIDACAGDSVVLRAVKVFASDLQWLRDGTDIPGAVSDTLTVRTSGVYSARVRSPFGCTVLSAALPVRFAARPTTALTVQGANPGCEGDTIRLRSAGESGVQYQWLLNGVLMPDTGSVYRARVSGIYRLVASRSGVCPDTSAALQVTFNSRPVVAAAGPNSVCIGTRALYHATRRSEQTVRWSITGGMAESSLTGDTLAVRWNNPLTGRVQVRVTDIRTGCASDTIIEVLVAPSLTPRITADRAARFCAGDSATLDAGEGYVSYRWNTGDTTRRIVIRSGGSYTVRVEDAGGCSGSSTAVSFVVQQPPAPRVFPEGPLDMCEGDSVLLDAGGGYAMYRWNTGDTTRAILARAISTAARYHVTVRDSIGCEGVSTDVEIRGMTRPVAAIVASGPLEFCEGDSVRLRSDSPQPSYLWSTGDTTESILVKRGGLYILTVSAGAGCRAADTAAVLMHARPDTIIRGPRNVCIGSEAEYTVGATGGARYRWAGPGTVLDDTGLTTVRFTFATAGRHTITLDVDAPGPCDASASIVVDVGSTLQVALDPAGDATLCEGDTLVLSGPDGYTSYRWSTGDTTRVLRIHTSGAFALEVSDGRGCSGVSDTVRVAVSTKPAPVIQASPGRTACLGDSIVLQTARPYARYRWSTGDTTAQIVLRARASVSVAVFDSNGCTGLSSVDEYFFLPKALPRILASGPLSFCEGDSVTLSADGVYDRYVWSNGASTRVIVVRTSGVYFLRVDSAGTCEGITDTLRVVVYPRPAVPRIVLSGDTLYADPSDTYRWYRDGVLLPGESARTLQPAQAGAYVVEVANTFGCANRSLPFPYTPAATASTVIGVPHIEAAPGDRIRIPLVLQNTQNFARGLSSFTTRVSFRADLLVPQNVAFADTGLLRHVTLTGRDTGAGDSLLFLDAIVALGAVERSEIRVESFVWSGAPVSVRTNSGELRVKVCEEGGARLVDMSQTLALRAQPNPFNAGARLEFNTVETGYTVLRIYDSFGRCVAEPVNGLIAAGGHQVYFDASNIASGAYYCVLLTGTLRADLRLVVLK